MTDDKGRRRWAWVEPALILAGAILVVVVVVALLTRDEIRGCFGCGAASSVANAPGSPGVVEYTGPSSREAYNVCRALGVEELARRLSADPNPADVARTYVRSQVDESVEPETTVGYVGCLRGFEDRSAVPPGD